MMPPKPTIDILVRLQEAQDKCLLGPLTHKDDEIYRELILDVLFELNLPILELQLSTGYGLRRHILGKNSPHRAMRRLVYSHWKKLIKVRRINDLAGCNMCGGEYFVDEKQCSCQKEK